MLQIRMLTFDLKWAKESEFFITYGEHMPSEIIQQNYSAPLMYPFCSLVVVIGQI